MLGPVLRKAEDGNERDGLKGSSTACVVLIDTAQVRTSCSVNLLQNQQPQGFLCSAADQTLQQQISCIIASEVRVKVTAV